MPDHAFEPSLGRSERLERVLERDGHECIWCRRPLHIAHPWVSTEHVGPRLKGGPPWLENEVAACRACNRRRGHLAPVQWLEICEREGLRPNRDVLDASLRRLERAIEQRGGQRRARPYLAAQLRRLERITR